MTETVIVFKTII